MGQAEVFYSIVPCVALLYDWIMNELKIQPAAILEKGINQ